MTTNTALNYEIIQARKKKLAHTLTEGMGVYAMSAPHTKISEPENGANISPFDIYNEHGDGGDRALSIFYSVDKYFAISKDELLERFSHFDFNRFLYVYPQYVGYCPADVHEIASLENVVKEIENLFHRYDDAGASEESFFWRIRQLHFFLWYSILGLNVERVNEFEHWLEMIECACCPIQLENVSICIRLLGGQFAEDRETYLAKLRPHYRKRILALQNKDITCWCAEGLVS